MNHCMPTAVRLFAYGSLAVPLRQSDGISLVYFSIIHHLFEGALDGTEADVWAEGSDVALGYICIKF